MNIGIINSSKQLHLVGYFYIICTMMHGSMYIKLINTRLSILKRRSFVFYENETSLRLNRSFRVHEKCAQGKI